MKSKITQRYDYEPFEIPATQWGYVKEGQPAQEPVALEDCVDILEKFNKELQGKES